MDHAPGNSLPPDGMASWRDQCKAGPFLLKGEGNEMHSISRGARLRGELQRHQQEILLTATTLSTINLTSSSVIVGCREIRTQPGLAKVSLSNCQEWPVRHEPLRKEILLTASTPSTINLTSSSVIVGCRDFTQALERLANS
ncbi:hypothetical protein [uncultured Imperialibacter sp.]|uniref:hypothetical protein n=1 Tax=uncultured Imperialibacter sp. TaxID=1672639 RepID=UPI0030D973EB